MNDELDLSGYHILIATPCHDGKYEATFLHSLINTKEVITKHGGTVKFLEARYCADIYYARATLFGCFYRQKEATHLLFIDSDMGWDFNDVIRMLQLKCDFISGVGPRKQYPLNVVRNFACSLRDDFGQEVPLYHTIETRVGEVSEVGMAFSLISRSCAERMVAAYPELEFESSENVTDYALFEPIIINKGKEYPRRRLSEDYSFCYRWRKIGGKVEVLLDVTLQHVGSHKFEGCLLNALHNETGDEDYKDG